jgi:hypothetical protein
VKLPANYIPASERIREELDARAGSTR